MLFVLLFDVFYMCFFAVFSRFKKAHREIIINSLKSAICGLYKALSHAPESEVGTAAEWDFCMISVEALPFE